MRAARIHPTVTDSNSHIMRPHSDAPPQTEVGPRGWSMHDPHSFMMMRRMVWNLLACLVKGLVKKSAMLSSVRTKGTSISNFSTMSRTKKCRRSTCFMRSWCSGLYETSP